MFQVWYKCTRVSDPGTFLKNIKNMKSLKMKKHEKNMRNMKT